MIIRYIYAYNEASNVNLKLGAINYVKYSVYIGVDRILYVKFKHLINKDK